VPRLRFSPAFALFIALNAMLFLRPAEVIAALDDLPIYEVTILCCLAVACPRVLAQLAPRSLRGRPITACVLALLAAVVLSHLSQFALADAKSAGAAFAKVVLYYLLLVGALDRPARLRTFLGWVGLFILALTSMALLQHHGVIDNLALAPHQERVFDPQTGEVLYVNVRLCGAGIFANPNDLSRILVVGIAVSLYWLGDRRHVLLKPFWLAATGLFGYALVLTQSRGGFIDLAVTLAVLGYARFGMLKTLVLGGLLVAAVLAAGQGRLTDLDVSEGTGQQRIQLWSDGLEAMRSSPLFGIGMDKYPELTGGLGAHNSFVHSYVELGFVGGTLFVGACYCALWMPWRLGRCRPPLREPELARLRPYLLAILAGYAAGMVSSSRCYALPTYMLLGLATAYFGLATARAPAAAPRVGPRLLLRLTLVSVVALVALQAYVVAFANWGGAASHP
jgi:O-antigen ligase